MPSQPNNRRHRVLIDLPVQLGMALRLVALWLATMAVASLIAVLMQFYSDPQSGLLNHLLDPKNWVVNIVALVVTLPIAVLYLFRFSHRFAGPVFRLRKEMRKLAEEGSAPPLKFRQGDYWRDMADEFNALAERLARSEAARNADQHRGDLSVVGGDP